MDILNNCTCSSMSSLPLKMSQDWCEMAYTYALLTEPAGSDMNIGVLWLWFAGEQLKYTEKIKGQAKLFIL